MRRRGELIGKLGAGRIRSGIRGLREVEGGGGLDRAGGVGRAGPCPASSAVIPAARIPLG